MSLGQRFGNFLLIAGAVSLFIFYASLYSESKEIHLEALLIGGAALFIGWRMRFAKRPAPPSGKGGSETRPDKAPPPKPAPSPQNSGGLLSGLFRGPAKPAPKAAAPPPKAPPPPPPKKGLAGLFGAKPKPSAPAPGKPPQRK
jgi:hypothetical protein